MSFLENKQLDSKRPATREINSFADIFQKKLSCKKDEFVTSSMSIYGSSLYTQSGITCDAIKTVETDKYTISGKEGGYLRLLDKETNEGFNWKLSENMIQVDSESSQKFLINDLGAGFFNMVVVDSSLENAIKESLGVDELKGKPLENFTVHKDSNTLIIYSRVSSLCGTLQI